MKAIVLGGTGLVGYHSTLALLANDVQITVVSRGSIKDTDLFPKEVKMLERYVFNMSADELESLFVGFDAMVYALGPDDREVPLAPAYDFFYDKLVLKCNAICAAAKHSGIKRIVVTGSYFTFFDRANPHWLLSKHHPYIRCRVEQTNSCLALADSNLTMIILELPYIFGIMPHRDPLWKDLLVTRLNKMWPWIYYPSGGSAMISAKFCGRAIHGAIKYGKTGTYTIGHSNLSWKEMLAVISKVLYGKEKKVITVPTSLAMIYGIYEKLITRSKGEESGLDYAKIIPDILSKQAYIPEELTRNTMNELQLSSDDLNEALIETFEQCR